MALGASFSAVFITIVNAFMNAPRGFDVVNGQLVDVSPILAMFNPAMPTKVAHVVVTAYMTSAFVLLCDWSLPVTERFRLYVP